MNELVQKISSYHILNYFIPGILFAILCDKITPYNFIQEDWMVGIFLYYFIGMLISRVGSLTQTLCDLLCYKDKEEKQNRYKKFIEASQKDSKIETLLEVANMYRSLCTMFGILICLKIWSLIHISNNVSLGILVILMLALFFFSYIKQKGFIADRVEHYASKK